MTCNFKNLLQFDKTDCRTRFNHFTIQSVLKQATRARMSTWLAFSVAHMFSEGFEQSTTTVQSVTTN